jgi:tellurite resistance protein
MINHHAGLIYTMVLVSAADREMTDAELRTIGDIVQLLPIFADFDTAQLTKVAADCAAVLSEDEGLDASLDMIAGSLPGNLRETAYALGCDVAAADGRIEQEEARILEIIRDRLGIERLVSVAIERGARARHATA